MIKKSSNKNINLDRKDIIFILFFVSKNNIIDGKLMFVKQIFLLLKKIIPEMFLKFEYYPSNFGPFSKILVNEIDKLTENKYVVKKENINRYGEIIYRFKLTDNGKEKAKNSFNKLSEKIKDKILVNKAIWDGLGYIGILRLVYSEYPEYTIKSKIKEEVESWKLN